MHENDVTHAANHAEHDAHQTDAATRLAVAPNPTNIRRDLESARASNPRQEQDGVSMDD